MNETKLKGLMGLCVRAGQAVFGEDSCMKAVREGKTALLLTDGGIAENAGAKYRALCEKNGVLSAVLPEGFLEEATGKPGKAMAVRSGGFAEQMIRCLEISGRPENTDQ